MKYFVFLLAACALSATNTSTAAAQESAEKPALMVIKFHADWCGSCRAMGPVLEDLTNKLDGTSVLFYSLDFTNNSTEHQAKLMSTALGIDKIVNENYGTGFLLVIDSKTKEVKSRLTKEQTVKEMEAEITALL